MRYFDTGVLLKLYFQEPNSAEAVALVQASGAPVPLSQLHRLEMMAAMGQRRGRGDISSAKYARLVTSFENDVAGGVFEEKVASWGDVFARAETLVKAHGVATMCRSLDVLHVALALELGATEFCTLDVRQGEMAKAAGMVVVSKTMP